MSISTYADLQTSVANWLHRADLTSIIPDLVLLGEKRIFRDVRCRVMETALTGTIANGVIAVPSDYLEIKFAYINSTPTSNLIGASASQIYAKYPTRSAAGKPVYIGREGSNFIFGPYPDSAYTIGGIYYAKPTSIQSTANALFTANPDLYLFASLCEAAPYIKDSAAVALWETKYAQIVSQLRAEDAGEYGSGSGMIVVAA